MLLFVVLLVQDAITAFLWTIVILLLLLLKFLKKKSFDKIRQVTLVSTFNDLTLLKLVKKSFTLPIVQIAVYLQILITQIAL